MTDLGVPGDGAEADVGEEEAGEDALLRPLANRVEQHLAAAVRILAVTRYLVMDR